MFCTICGNTIYQDESFCSKCGKGVKPKSPQPHGGHTHPQRGVPAPPPGGHSRQKEYAHPPNPGGRGAPPQYTNYELPPPPQNRGPAPSYHQHGGHSHHHEYRTPPPQSGGGLKKAAIIAACIALFALGVSIGGIFVMRRSQQGTTPPPQDSSSIGNEAPATPTPLPERITPTPTPPPEDEAEETPPPEETEPPVEDGRSARFPFPGNMSRYGGSAEADVAFLQNTLNNIRRNYRSIRVIDVAGGTFGAATFGAVVDFQLRVGLPPTGVVNEDTWYALVEVFENPPAEPDPPFEHITQEWYVTLVNLHLREEPSTAGESMDVIDQWTRVWVAYYIPQDSWFFVQTEEGYTGYMKAEFLLLDGILP
ncbi:MAG: peptidoglycan-binding protein [Defluviitaleaceae bacterium]|nr:peptidoglycan-binding protein [Defluviitaleaceae bacterium]